MLHSGALWSKLDISNTSGVAAVPSDAFIRALSRAFGHRMEELHARGCGAFLQRTLIRLLRANPATLRTVTLGVEKPEGVQLAGIRAAMQRSGTFAMTYAISGVMAASMPRDLPAMRIAVASAGPALEVLEADIRAGSRQAVHLLRNRYRPLRVNKLNVQGFDRTQEMTLMADALAQHPSLRTLELTYAPLAPYDYDGVANMEDDVHVVAFGKLCDALAAATHVSALELTECSCCGASLEHLGRLLGAGTLRKLSICAGYEDEDIDDEAAPFAGPTPAFAAGLRASALTQLTLTNVGLFDTIHGADVLLALVGHATLRKLDINSNPARGKEAARAAVAAIAALLAADGLTELDCSCTKLGRRTSVGPMYAALATTKRLRKLSARCCSLKASDLVRHLAPAVRCSGLLELELCCAEECDECDARFDARAAKIQAEVAKRARAQGYLPYGELPADRKEEHAEEEDEWEEGTWEDVEGQPGE